MTPQEEAADLFDQVVKSLIATGTSDLIANLRRCQHACQLLGWNDARAWFQRELSGYPGDDAGVPTPAHRTIYGVRKWQAQGTERRLDQAAEKVLFGRGPDEETEEVSFVFSGGVENLELFAKGGFTKGTGRTKEAILPITGTRVTLERVEIYTPIAFSKVLQEIETTIFNFASQSLATLRYGNVLTDFWAEYRGAVEAHLSTLGMTAHLNAIQDCLRSENPESWRAAVLECRNLLDDLANYFWRDPRDIYAPLGIDVRPGKFANRLAAYVHQKGLMQAQEGLTGTRGRFLRDEIERVATSIRSLIAVQSEAHSPISRQDAITAALGTYFIIGELVLKTDMQPVESYGEPAAAKSPASSN